ncbi:TonB-dependent vitamin B12 receptor [Dyella subtropica]|uniref:TonB-dependent vitamin B12 receptor n=1 Tax=Dyella subtropica TaxID=2992127 RepID=UPI00224F637B|nr:TonB-dependent vitamin B12 receptor [Dyella subtropica]
MSLHSSFARQSALAAALCCVALPCVCSPLFAADAAADSASDLNGVVVTATRTEQTQASTLAAVTVIDRADIERLQPQSVQDLLQGTPGMSIANNGGLGKSTSLFLRGTEADHVLILVDGVKIGSATLGQASIQNIPVDQIERIEIVRGPFSSLYGSEALGGVIQIFTRRPQGGFAPNFNLGYGTQQTVRAGAGVGGKVGDGWYAAEATHENTDGINACRGKPFPHGAGCYVYEPDRDGFRNHSVSLKGGYRFSEAWDADAQWLRTWGFNKYDGSYTNQSEVVDQVAGARLHYRPSKALTLTLNVGQSADLSDDYENRVYVDTFNTRRDLGSLQGDLSLGGGLWSLGYDWQRDRVNSTTTYARTRRLDRGVFAQWQQTFGAQSLQASVRRDDNQQFGGKTTGSLLWGWDFTSVLRLTASAGTAFKAPTFNELYYPGYGNAALKPETSHNYELGLRGTHSWGNWSLNAFENRIRDLIAYDASIGLPGNVERVRIHGVEAVANTSLAGWDLRGTATWLDPRNESNGPNHDKWLPRRAGRSARIDADRRFGAFSVGASVYAADDRYDDLANKQHLGGYALTDLRFAYAIDRAWKLQLSVRNVFDKRYETAAYYNQLGRTAMLSVSYQPAL